MDSRLLNAFHDDPFDGNYVKYDTDTQFWSNDSGTLGLQLAETLHGILPIAPTEVISNNLYSNSILKEGDYSLESKNSSNTNSKMYENYEDVSPIGIHNKRHQTIEIVSVDPNGEYDSDFLQSTDDDDDDEDDEDDDGGNDENVEIKQIEGTNGTVAFDDLRSCSRSTFRSRTDSSSIGDYESHSSDYDDETDEMDFETVPSQFSLNSSSTKPVDNCTLNSDGSDLKKSIDDTDPFAMQLDVSTFDLAAFITQDDQVFYNHSTSMAADPTPQIKVQETVKLTSDSDSDSDVIVDVETVENEEIGVDSWNQGKENEIECFDNVKCDPSWSPGKHKVVEKKEAKPAEPNFPGNFTIIPNKRQSVFFKKKFGIGRGKNINMHRNPLQATPKSEAKNKSKQINNNNNLKKNLVEEKLKNSSVQTKVIAPIVNKPENIVKKQELIIPPVKIKIEKPIPGDLVDQKQIIAHDNCSTKPTLKNEPLQIKPEPKADEEDTDMNIVEELVIASETSEKLPKKRKLNLEEYKKRRENPSLLCSISKNPNMQHAKTKTESSVQTTMPVVIKPLPKVQIIKPPQTEAVTSIVKSLKENQSSKPFVDPITEAKNKVLRLQELKKAQQIKIIDSTVSSKVARVTKLLPLKDIVKGCYNSKTTGEGDGSGINNSEYEEIIIVSTGCNTDITIPPNGYNSVPQNAATNSSRSLLKSNVLLANISNSFQKVRSDDSVKISTNSLIVSIQDVVVKKSSPILLESTNQVQTSTTSTSTSEHGEDKIIMHLRKDRIRKRNVSQSTQTELLPEFSTLVLPRVQSSDHRSNSFASRRTKVRRKYRARQNSFSSDEETSNYRSQGNSTSSQSLSKHSRRHRSSISSSYSESEDYSKRNHRYSGSSSHSRGCSISSTERRSRSKSFDRIYNRNSRSRSKSSSRSRSKRRDTSRQHAERNVSAPAVEERRIVYVGRIEQDTTKEMLRRKFVAYGPIKQITIHYKDTGMKYGFVTYEKSEDAFRVIDSGQNDDMINMYDISFGGRRAFCRASYADLDNAGMNTYQSYVAPRQTAPPKEEDSFEALLLKVKAKLNATKSSGPNLKT